MISDTRLSEAISEASLRETPACALRVRYLAITLKFNRPISSAPPTFGGTISSRLNRTHPTASHLKLTITTIVA